MSFCDKFFLKWKANLNNVDNILKSHHDIFIEKKSNPEFEEAESWVKFLQNFLLSHPDQKNIFIFFVAMLEKLRKNQ